MSNLTLTLLLFFVVAVVLSLLMHRFFVIRAERYKIKKANISAERWSSQSKPVLGGITFYIAFLFSILVFAVLFNVEPLISSKTIGIVLAVTISFLMGLADDMLNTPPSFKFIVQILIAFLLIYTNVYIRIFNVPVLNYLLTILWVVGIMNSLNMLDNMDGITTTVSLSVLLGAIFLMLLNPTSNLLLLFLSIGMAASLISFLYYNWNPSKMYMGDNGSQGLGAFMAIIGIEIFWNVPQLEIHFTVLPFILVLLAFIVPISDTTAVTINRLMRGQSPFVGGRDHTTHHLSYFGLSDRNVALLLLSINTIAVASAIIIMLKHGVVYLPIWIIAGIALLVVSSLYSITKISKPKKP